MSEAVEELIACQKEIDLLNDELIEHHPEIMARLSQLQSEKASLVEKTKREIRDLGPGKHEFGEHVFKVLKGPTKVTIDVDAVMVDAEERGHTETLLEYGVLTYAGNVNQVHRLPDEMKAIYEAHLTETKGSSRVTFAKGLK